MPNRFYGFPLARLLSNGKIARRVSQILKNLLPFINRDILNRYANMLLIGSKKNQDLIFNDLIDSYSHLNIRFVVHSLDMDMMEGGRIENNYETQIHELFQLKKKYLNELLPFLSIDPRKDYSNSLGHYIKEKFEHFGFVGIKIYPALGFYPFDPKLNALYDFARNNNVPITVHCDKGGIYYQGKLTKNHLLPLNLDSKNTKNHNYEGLANEKMRFFKNNFTNPENYIEVLDKYPNLKICFAHFGGADEIERSKKGTSKDNFYLKIKQLMLRTEFPNVYTDISYTLSAKDDIINIILDDIKNPKLRDRILFGTDFYMTIREKSEIRLFDDFLKKIPTYDFQKIAVHNCNTFLQSNYFTP